MSLETLAATVPPPEIIDQFYPSGINSYTSLDGGKVHQTHKVIDSQGAQTILQKISPSLDHRIAADYAIVCERLKGDKWEVAEPLRSHDGQLVVTDQEQSNWRGYQYLESDGNEPPGNLISNVSLGLMIGRLSISLARLDYQPKFSIPHHHDIKHHAGKLIGLMPNMTDKYQDFAGQLICSLAKEPPIPGKEQVIHGDTKLENALYRGGMPFTMIDWDCLTLGSPMLDLADLLRSITGHQRDSRDGFNPTDLMPVVRAHRFGAKSDTPANDYFEQAMSATRTLSLCLAMRYLVDSVENSYFHWDPNKHPSAEAQNQFRARRQWLNYLSLL